MQPLLPDVERTTRLLKALADPTRLRIVAALSHRDLCVCHLQDLLRLSQPNVSRHLRILRLAGIVADRRVGLWVHYRLVPPSGRAMRELLDSLLRAVPRRIELDRKLERLLAAKGPGACK
jgi:ArsR family transcriptional regulator